MKQYAYIFYILRLITHLLWTILKWAITLIFYPFVYPFRIWARTSKSKLAHLLWCFLDDTPEWSDAGGSWFFRNECNSNTGIDKKSYGSWNDVGIESEKYVTNKYRRFWCSYKWALRNPMTNFAIKYESLGEADTEIVYDTRTNNISSKIKTEAEYLLKDKSSTGTYITILNKKYLRIDTAGIKKWPFVDRYFAWDIWMGYSGSKPHRFEAAFRPYLFWRMK